MQGNSNVLRHLLSRGASVHIRNRENHTPLYVAADAGYPQNVQLLREAGAHLHPDEVELAQMLKQKAIRSSTSSMSSSPVGGSSANSGTNEGVSGTTSGQHTAGVKEDEGKGSSLQVAAGNSRNSRVLSNGIDTEAVDCWSLAGV